MKPTFVPVSKHNEKYLKYVIIVSRYQHQWIFVQHQHRCTYEIPAGHIEKGESPEHAAQRELFEETGAIEYQITTLSDYFVEENQQKTYGRLYFAEVIKLGKLPDFEISKIILTKRVPKNLTYPELQPEFFSYALSKIEKSIS